jgi:hypothetical protein
MGNTRIIEKILSVLCIPVYLVWLVLRFLWQLLVDIAKNVYGRVVIALGAVVFGLLATYFLHFF